MSLKIVDGVRRYGCSVGNPNGIPEDMERCIEEVYSSEGRHAAAAERARIVAWLRRKNRADAFIFSARSIADEIKRGEHAPRKPEGSE